jgi:hypothetical protein
MYHCDGCGWDGSEPMVADEPSVSQDLLWNLRVCPWCGEKVYETRLTRVQICACGDRRGHPGPCQVLF